MAASAVDIGAPRNSAGYQEWNGTIPFRTSTASATSQPPEAPTAPPPASHGGSAIIISVPTVMLATAIVMMIA